MKITLKRMPSGNYFIFEDGESVGEAWRWPKKRTFGFTLHGVYWRPSPMGPNTVAGCTTSTVEKLRDLPMVVAATLKLVRTDKNSSKKKTKVRIKRKLVAKWSKKDFGMGPGVLVEQEAVYTVTKAEADSAMFAMKLIQDEEDFIKANIEVKMEEVK